MSQSEAVHMLSIEALYSKDDQRPHCLDQTVGSLLNTLVTENIKNAHAPIPSDIFMLCYTGRSSSSDETEDHRLYASRRCTEAFDACFGITDLAKFLADLQDATCVANPDAATEFSNFDLPIIRRMLQFKRDETRRLQQELNTLHETLEEAEEELSYLRQKIHQYENDVLPHGAPLVRSDSKRRKKCPSTLVEEPQPAKAKAKHDLVLSERTVLCHADSPGHVSLGDDKDHDQPDDPYQLAARLEHTCALLKAVPVHATVLYRERDQPCWTTLFTDASCFGSFTSDRDASFMTKGIDPDGEFILQKREPLGSPASVGSTNCDEDLIWWGESRDEENMYYHDEEGRVYMWEFRSAFDCRRIKRLIDLVDKYNSMSRGKICDFPTSSWSQMVRKLHESEQALAAAQSNEVFLRQELLEMKAKYVDHERELAVAKEKASALSTSASQLTSTVRQIATLCESLGIGIGHV
ncbi:hypothetical protein EIP91_007068 [Steccherinum ochraceum]|uniref:Uncharacterized protein n=1 Tax=Steccherinum ochraceum TaxID=92696 RepID=A0A4R0RFB5_9APHY|nr:hypothetical protein EIP91_007068 [Steccherinum ochraceum]